MSDKDKRSAEKELAAKNIRIAVIISVIAAAFYAAIVLVYI